MSFSFYVGAVIIITVILNGIIKHKAGKKKWWQLRMIPSLKM
jgi:hypothetical protein